LAGKGAIMMKDENKYALLIDAENVSSKYIEVV